MVHKLFVTVDDFRNKKGNEEQEARFKEDYLISKPEMNKKK